MFSGFISCYSIYQNSILFCDYICLYIAVPHLFVDEYLSFCILAIMHGANVNTVHNFYKDVCFNFSEYTGWVIQYVLNESGHHRFIYLNVWPLVGGCLWRIRRFVIVRSVSLGLVLGFQKTYAISTQLSSVLCLWIRYTPACCRAAMLAMDCRLGAPN